MQLDSRKDDLSLVDKLRDDVKDSGSHCMVRFRDHLTVVVEGRNVQESKSHT